MGKNNFFDFLFMMTSRERNGAIVLLILIFIMIGVRLSMNAMSNDNESIPDSVIEKIKMLEEEKNRNKKAFNENIQGDSIIDRFLFKFDPNISGKEELLKLGFSGRVADNIINYRNKGGKFRVKEDLKKIYGVDTVFYQKVEDFIFIKGNTVKKKEKFEINSTDSARWTTLNGIGPYFAGKICKYRTALGGFYKLEQLKEVYNFKEETFDKIKGELKVDTGLVKKVNINFSDITELKQHPYCRYENAKKIVDYRSLKGNYRSVNQLLEDSVIKAEIYFKLKPYLTVVQE